MKLIKLLKSDYSHPVDCIIGAKDLTLEDSILVSDQKYSLLKFNHVRMVVVKEFSETAIADIGKFEKDKAYILKKIITVAEYDSFDPSEYEVGDYVLVYEDVKTAKPGKPPVMPKPEPGMVFTPEEKTEVMQKYQEEMEKYATEVEKYETEVKKFIDETASKPAFGYLIKVIGAKTFEVIADISFETTKTNMQFRVLGKLPKEVATKVTKAIGGIKADESLKGLPISEILTKAFGLEFEEDVIGVVQEVNSSEPSTPTVE